MLRTEGCISADRDSWSEFFSASSYFNFSQFDNEQIKTPLTCRLVARDSVLASCQSMCDSLPLHHIQN